MDSEWQARNLKVILNNMFGGRIWPDTASTRREVFRKALEEVQASEANSHFLTVHEFEEAQGTTKRVNLLIASFGEGKATQWVVLAWYRGGWVNAVRPFTEDTANMPWLENFLREE